MEIIDMVKFKLKTIVIYLFDVIKVRGFLYYKWSTDTKNNKIYIFFLNDRRHAWKTSFFLWWYTTVTV